MTMGERILITGGTGFTGSFIVREFLENGARVTCLVRPGSSLCSLDNCTVDIVEGDITRPRSLVTAFGGHDFVVHNAALVNDWQPYDAFYRANIEGTRNVLHACIANDIKNVIVTGSVSSYGEENCFTVKDESSDDNSHYRYFLDRFVPCRMNHYRDTKALATREAVAIATEHRLNATIIEPVFVYGERELTTGFHHYIKSASNGMFVAPGSRKNRFPIIYAGDLAKAYYLAYRKKLSGVNRFIIGNRTPVTMDHIIETFCRKAGIRKPLLLPKWVCYFPGLALEAIYMLLRRKNAPLITRGRVNMFVDNLEFSSRKAENILGFKSMTSLDEGVERTVQWYQKYGYL